MLRSYQYSESNSISRSIQNPNFRRKEEEIARKFTLTHKGKGRMDKQCPICGRTTGDYFYSKWEIDYLCCSECKSVYADVDSETVAEYQNSEELLNLRLSEAYQEDAFTGREEMWSDFLEWTGMRTFRFLKRNKNLKIVDIGNRFREYTKLIKKTELCGKYNVRDSILFEDENDIEDGTADIVFWLDQMQKEPDPSEKIRAMRDILVPKGLLFIGTRAGSGFDILTLKENNEKIFPYEHITMPSVKGLTHMLEENGFKILEITTPGVMDVNYVLQSRERLDDREGFVKYLLEESDVGVLQEFQRFLQKGCLSSFVRVVACRA